MTDERSRFETSRRRFLAQTASGFGMMALADLLGTKAVAAGLAETAGRGAPR